MKGLALEIESALEAGATRKTLKTIEQELNALGFSLDRSMDVHGIARCMSTGNSYPCLTTGIKHIQTGMSAFHYELPKSANLKALHEYRMKTFAVVDGHMFSL